MFRKGDKVYEMTYLTTPFFLMNEMKQFRLDPKLYEVLQQIGQVADELQMNVYVVGGFVRDLLLLHENDDIDVVVEGDGGEFADKLKEKHGSKENFVLNNNSNNTFASQF